jgi:hypothetical protein
MSECIDITLENLDILCITHYPKSILILGKESKDLFYLNSKILKASLKQHLKTNNLFTRNSDLNFKDASVLNRFSELMIPKCFLNGFLMFLDSFPYSRATIDMIQNNLLGKKMLFIANEDYTEKLNKDIKSDFEPFTTSLLETKIEFDYIIFTDTHIFKYFDVLKMFTGKDSIHITTVYKSVIYIENQLCSTETHTLNNYNLECMVNEMAESNKVNEKTFLVLSKTGELFYF